MLLAFTHFFVGETEKRPKWRTFHAIKLSFFFGRASQAISLKKNIKSTRGVQFTILPASPCAADFYETRHTRSTHRHNHVYQIFCRSVQGLRSSALRRRPQNVCSQQRHLLGYESDP